MTYDNVRNKTIFSRIIILWRRKKINEVNVGIRMWNEENYEFKRSLRSFGLPLYALHTTTVGIFVIGRLSTIANCESEMCDSKQWIYFPAGDALEHLANCLRQTSIKALLFHLQPIRMFNNRGWIEANVIS